MVGMSRRYDDAFRVEVFDAEFVIEPFDGSFLNQINVVSEHADQIVCNEDYEFAGRVVPDGKGP